MRKLVLLGLVCALTSGCGRGWLPMFRGAPCQGTACGLNAPAMPTSYDAGCSTCGTAAGYGSYDSGSVVSSDSYGGIVNSDSYYDGPIVGQGYSSQGTTLNTPMQALPQTGN